MSNVPGNEAFQRGQMECIQDRCENIPFAGLGGLENRMTPKAPDYIPAEDVDDFIAGYKAAALEMYGDDWQTCEFSWQHALTIEPPEPKICGACNQERCVCGPR